MQNQVEVYFDTSPRASPIARDFFPRLRRCAGSDPAASDPRISLHPGLVRSAPRGVAFAGPNADFSRKASDRRSILMFPTEPECVPCSRLMGAMRRKRIFKKFGLFFHPLILRLHQSGPKPTNMSRAPRGTVLHHFVGV